MRNILSGRGVLSGVMILLVAGSVSAGDFSSLQSNVTQPNAPQSNAPITLAQLSGGIDGSISGRIGGDVGGGTTRNRPADPNRYQNQNQYDSRRQQAQRYVCVVQPPRSENRNRPYVCSTYFGRVGESCRCQNVVGSGRVDLAN